MTIDTIFPGISMSGCAGSVWLSWPVVMNRMETRDQRESSVWYDRRDWESDWHAYAQNSFKVPGSVSSFLSFLSLPLDIHILVVVESDILQCRYRVHLWGRIHDAKKQPNYYQNRNSIISKSLIATQANLILKYVMTTSTIPHTMRGDVRSRRLDLSFGLA